LSVLGDRLYGLAVMWVVYEATGSASMMGLVAVVESLPYILIGSFGRNLICRFASFGRRDLSDPLGRFPLQSGPEAGGPESALRGQTVKLAFHMQTSGSAVGLSPTVGRFHYRDMHLASLDDDRLNRGVVLRQHR
jgi:hypothetical protein